MRAAAFVPGGLRGPAAPTDLSRSPVPAARSARAQPVLADRPECIRSRHTPTRRSRHRSPNQVFEGPYAAAPGGRGRTQIVQKQLGRRRDSTASSAVRTNLGRTAAGGSTDVVSRTPRRSRDLRTASPIQAGQQAVDLTAAERTPRAQRAGRSASPGPPRGPAGAVGCQA